MSSPLLSALDRHRSLGLFFAVCTPFSYCVPVRDLFDLPQGLEALCYLTRESRSFEAHARLERSTPSRNQSILEVLNGVHGEKAQDCPSANLAHPSGQGSCLDGLWLVVMQWS
jgi:hypothetical protein